MISKKEWLETNNSQTSHAIWKFGDWVRITKLSEHSDAKVPACPGEYYSYGDINPLSLPVDYWAEGFLRVIPEIGKPLIMDRRIRNGVHTPGIFQTSLVQEIHGPQIATMNSIYLIEVKSPPASASFTEDPKNEKD